IGRQRLEIGMPGRRCRTSQRASSRGGIWARTSSGRSRARGGCSCRTCASTASTRPAWRRARPGRSSARSTTPSPASWMSAPGAAAWGHLDTDEPLAKPGARWLIMSDVCKHCGHAPCLEACPTGSIIRTEFDSVYIQQDVCNGCGYCVPACPFAVVEVDREGTGKAHKCTLCYDRLKDGLEPACSKACPTDSIRFGPVDELLERARVRVAELRARGIPAYLYGSGGVLEDDCDTSALGGLNCFFLLIDRPEVYNLPPVAKRPSANTGVGLAASALAALALAGAVLAAFRAGRGEGREGPGNGPTAGSV